MRKVFNSADVFHKWANQTQDEARNASASVSFSLGYLFSYNANIARVITRNGERAAFFTTERWTVTTAKHQTKARWAATHLSRFDVANLSDLSSGIEDRASEAHHANLKDYLQRIEDTLGKAKRARAEHYRAMHYRNAASLEKQVTQYLSFFGLADTVDTEAIKQATGIPAAYAEVFARLERERKEAEDKRMAELAGAAEAWRRGLREAMPYGYPVTMLRHTAAVMRDGVVQYPECVETSRGATVYVEDAHRLYRALVAREAKHGDTIGGYTVRHIDAQVIRIGCHEITRAEVERFADAMGWTHRDAVADAASRLYERREALRQAELA